MFKWLYHKKTRGGFEITRILFFKFKKKLPEKDGKVVMPVPPVKNVGRCTYYDKDWYIENPETVIGAFCSIGARVSLGRGEHPLDYLTTSPYFYFDFLGWKDKSAPAHNEFNDLRPIIIGNDVWIGGRVYQKRRHDRRRRGHRGEKRCDARCSALRRCRRRSGEGGALSFRHANDQGIAGTAMVEFG